MKTWIIVGIIMGLLLFAGIVLIKANTQAEGVKTDKVTSCNCGNSCTADNNCGLATCGAINDRACSCNKG